MPRNLSPPEGFLFPSGEDPIQEDEMTRSILFQYAYIPDKSRHANVDNAFLFHTNLRLIFEIVDHFSEFWGREYFWLRIRNLLDFQCTNEKVIEDIVSNYCYGRKVFKRGASDRDNASSRLAELADRINHVTSRGPPERPSRPWADQVDAWRSRLHRVLGELGVLFRQVKHGTCAPELKIKGSASGAANFAASPSDDNVRQDEHDHCGSMPSSASRTLYSRTNAELSPSSTSNEHLDPFSGRKKPSRSLWVGNVPRSTTSRDVEEEFQHFGRITSVNVLNNRYCAFVNFERTEDAVYAREILNGERIFPGAEPAVINFTPSHDRDPDGRRRPEMEERHAPARPIIHSSRDASMMSSSERTTPSKAQTANQSSKLLEDQTASREAHPTPNRIHHGTGHDRRLLKDRYEIAEHSKSDMDTIATSRLSDGETVERPTHSSSSSPKSAEHRAAIPQSIDETFSPPAAQTSLRPNKRQRGTEGEQFGTPTKRAARGTSAISVKVPNHDKCAELVTEPKAIQDVMGIDDSQSVANASTKGHTGAESNPAKDRTSTSMDAINDTPASTRGKLNLADPNQEKQPASPESADGEEEVSKMEELWQLHLKQVQIYQQQVHDLESALCGLQAQQEVRNKSLEGNLQAIKKGLDQHMSDSLPITQDQQTRTLKVEQALGPLETHIQQAVALQSRVESIEAENREFRDEFRRYSDGLQQAAKVGSDVEDIRMQQIGDHRRLTDLEGQVNQLTERLSQRIVASEQPRAESLEAELQDTREQLRQAQEQLRQQSAASRVTPPTPPISRLPSALASTHGHDWSSLPERSVDSCLKGIRDELRSMREGMRFKIRAMDAAKEPEKEKFRISDVSYELGELLEKVSSLI